MITGRVVTMNDQHAVVPSGAVYVVGATIAAVQPASAPAPEGFGDARHLATRGTIYPGLIELHNHLSYNILRLWPVPKEYGDRNQWAGTSEYRTLISGPMGVIGRHPELVPALVRYVEAKSAVGFSTQSTTISGMASSSGAGRERLNRSSESALMKSSVGEFRNHRSRADFTGCTKAPRF